MSIDIQSDVLTTFDDIWKVFDMLNSGQSHATHKITDPSTENEFCNNCGSNSIISDHVSGDTICSQCGSILSERMIDHTAEWRNYSNEDGSRDSSKQRCCTYVDPLFPESSTATTIAPKKGNGNPESWRKYMHRSIPYGEKMLMEVRKEIRSSFGDLPESIQKRAIFIYRDYKKTINARTHKVPINRAGNRKGVIAACIKRACGKEYIISDKELVRRFGCAPANIAYGRRMLENNLPHSGYSPSLIVDTDPKNYISSYCVMMGLPLSFANKVNIVIDFVMKIRLSSRKLHSSKPKSLAAGCLWYVIKQDGLDKPFEQHLGFSKQFLNKITGVSEATINSLCEVISTSISSEHKSI